MGMTTAIAWTDHTFNPWWGCSRVSPACAHCYAEAFAKRVGQDVWGDKAERRFFGDKHWAEPVKWNRLAEAEGARRRVFCASMADVFEDRDELVPHRERLLDLIEATPALDWQLLTKRPENVVDFAARWDRWGCWPKNAWLGVTAENQAMLEERLSRACATYAPLRFLSCEPLLGALDLSEPIEFDAVDWVIVGGESGPKHRPLNLDHARSLRDQCLAADVPFFFKQVGGRTPSAGGDELDGEAYKQFPRSPAESALT